jgi:hypothetical protein
MAKEITRHIKRELERELWARSAGRCEFDGCNRLLYKSPVTQEIVNISEKAHIYSFSEDGPRGWGPFKYRSALLNDISNLLLVCHDCHCKIDNEKDGGRYPASLLLKWKDEHERRITIVTGVEPSKKSQVVLYGANIGDEKSPLQPEHAKWALFPKWYPAEERAISIAMSWEGKDNNPKYWATEESNLIQAYNRYICPLLTDGCHFSVFGFAPMPLLIRLGTLFTDKIPVQAYQLQREPEQTWQWTEPASEFTYIIHEPQVITGPPVLIISLSAPIARDRITSVLGPDVTFWELTIEEPHNDFLKTMQQLSEFRKVCRKLMVSISYRHGTNTPLAIFPAMPVACAVDLGRIRMPKSEMPWIIYDQNNTQAAFVTAITIGG